MTTDLPARFDNRAAWVASDLNNDPTSWLKTLTRHELVELELAATRYLDSGKDIGEITQKDFTLPTLSAHLQKLKEQLLYGTGLEVIRGLPVGQYSIEMSACIFCGMGAHLGTARSQNAQGHVLGHVRDAGLNSSDPDVRIYQTAERQSFHTDSADVVGLLCIQPSASGGESLLVSALSLYNRYQELRPDLLPLLFEPIATDRRGEVPEGAKPYMNIPVFSWFQNHLTVFYQRQYINSAQRFDEAPRLTERHVEALDLFDTLANDPSLYIRMQLEAGDMQFIYNHSQLHDRMSFVDSQDPAKRRHMLRLWLSPMGDRELPEWFRERYGSIEVGNRGGIVTAETRLHAPLTW